MSNEIWVFAEQQEGKVRKVTFELLTAVAEFSKKINQAVGVILLGSGLQEAVKGLTPYADKIYLIDDPALASYTSDAYLVNMAPFIKEEPPLRERIFSQGWPCTYKQVMPLTARVWP
jgi:electron transfer flavoprotein alpha subunit